MSSVSVPVTVAQGVEQGRDVEPKGYLIGNGGIEPDEVVHVEIRKRRLARALLIENVPASAALQSSAAVCLLERVMQTRRKNFGSNERKIIGEIAEKSDPIFTKHA
jgi:hypothetical protein